MTAPNHAPKISQWKKNERRRMREEMLRKAREIEQDALKYGDPPPEWTGVEISTEYLGVHCFIIGSEHKFTARLSVNYGEHIHLGEFTTIEEAARARDLKCIEVYGPENARLNLPRSEYGL